MKYTISVKLRSGTTWSQEGCELSKHELDNAVFLSTKWWSMIAVNGSRVIVATDDIALVTVTPE
jgi:hypothetical protein